MTPERVLCEVDRVMGSGVPRWGRDDCCTAAADVFKALWGVDLMARFRGPDNIENMARLIVKNNLAFVVAGQVAGLGLVATDACPGAVGLVYVGGRFGHAGAICVEPGAWARRIPNGYLISPTADFSWRLPCQR